MLDTYPIPPRSSRLRQTRQTRRLVFSPRSIAMQSYLLASSARIHLKLLPRGTHDYAKFIPAANSPAWRAKPGWK